MDLPKLELHLLGRTEILLDKAPVTAFNSTKTKALLIYLAVTNQAHARYKLAGLFWPDMPDQRAAANLRKSLTFLRKSVGMHLATNRFTVAMASESNYWADALSFEYMSTHVEQTPNFDILERATNLYRGNFLEGFSVSEAELFTEWADAHRAYLQLQAQRILEMLAEHYIGQNLWGKGLTVGRRILVLDPWYEKAHRMVMRSLFEEGRRNEALRHYEQIVQTLKIEMDLPPDPETKALYEQIRNGKFTKVTATVQHARKSRQTICHNLATPMTPLVGRTRELQELDSLFADTDRRLITISGPGGIGKSRLAVAAAYQSIEKLEQATFIVYLAPLNEPAAIIQAIADVLNFQFQADGRTSEEQLLAYLASRQLTLLLDNFEHLLDGVHLIQKLLEQCPDLRLLITSRERLRLTGETVYTLKSLDFPSSEDSNELKNYDAIQLFIETSLRVCPHRILQTQELQNVAHICRMVGGIPLGIILAAVWIEHLTPATIAAELTQGFELLESNLSDLPERQRSMQAVMDYSWRRLSTKEQSVFMGLSVFRGGFTLAAAKDIAGASLPILARLVDKSFIQVAVEERYEIHELLRQFSQGKLALEPNDEARLRKDHSRYYCALLGEQDEHIWGNDSARVIRTIESDIDNVRVAWHQAVMDAHFGDLENALSVLMDFYELSGRRTESYTALKFALEKVTKKYDTLSVKTPQDKTFLAKLFATFGQANYSLAHYEQALDYYQLALNLFVEIPVDVIDTRRHQAFTLRWMGVLISQTDHRQAKALFEQSLALVQEIDNQNEIAGILNWLAHNARNLGNITHGIQLLQESLEIYRDLDKQLGMAWTLELLGHFQQQMGQFSQAEESHRRCLSLFRKAGVQAGVNSILSGLGHTLIWHGKFAEGCELLSERITQDFDTGKEPHLAFAHHGLSMGFLHQGEYAQAKEHSTVSYSEAQESELARYIALALWSKGQNQLVEDDPVTTKQILEDSLAVVEEIDLVGFRELPLSCLAFNAYQLGDFPAMKRYIKSALLMATDTQIAQMLLYVFPAVALYLLGQKKTCLAIEIYAAASRYEHVRNSCWFEEVVGRHVSNARSALTRSEVRDAEQRGATCDLWVMAASLLLMLEEDTGA